MILIYIFSVLRVFCIDRESWSCMLLDISQSILVGAQHSRDPYFFFFNIYIFWNYVVAFKLVYCEAEWRFVSFRFYIFFHLFKKV